MDLEIEDHNILQEPLVAKRINIKMIEIQFNEGAKFEIYFYKSVEEYDMRLLKKEIIEISGDEYKEWKNEDQYVIDLICKKLGISQKILAKENIIINE